MENIDKELSELNRLKLEASEREDYRAASEYKKKILQLLEKKQELEKQAQKKDTLSVTEKQPRRSASDLSNDSSDDEENDASKDDNEEEDRSISPNSSSSNINEAIYDDPNASGTGNSVWQKPTVPNKLATRTTSGVLRHPSRESVKFSSRHKDQKEQKEPKELTQGSDSSSTPTASTPTLSVNGAPAATSAPPAASGAKPPGVVPMKVVASVGGINSVVNLKVDLNFTVESVVQKVLRRFPEDNEKYNLYLPNDISTSAMEYSKKMIDYYPQLEAAKFSLDLKKRSTSSSPTTPLQSSHSTSGEKEKEEKKPNSGTLRGHNYGETDRDTKGKSGRFGEIFGRSSRRFSEADMKPLKDANYMDPEVFFESVKRDSKDDVAYLITQEGHQVMLQRDADNQTALHIAATHNSIDVAQTLLKNKMEFNSKDKFGNTPTMSSMIHGNLRITELLLQEGAEPSAPNLAGNNALHFMFSGWDDQQSPRVFHMLMRKCNLNSQNKEKDTPFHKVVASGNIECLKMMLNYQSQYQNYPTMYPGLTENQPLPQNIKPDLNIVNNQKETCLHVAARLGNMDIVKLLLEFGADPNKAGDCGTPKNIAQLYGFEEIANFLAANAGQFEQQEQERGAKAENALKSEIQERLKLQNQYEQLNKLYKEEIERRKRAEANNQKLQAQVKELQEQYETLRKFAENHMKERDKLSLEKKTLEQQLEEATTSPKQRVVSVTSSGSLVQSDSSNFYTTLRSKPDQHENLCRELKQRINVSSFREWEQAYIDHEIDMGIDSSIDNHRYEQLVEEWHHNKLKEIEQMLFNEEDVVLVSPHRRFIKMGELFLGAAEPQVGHTGILMNDLFLVCCENEAKDPKKLLLAMVIPMDMCAANDMETQIGGKFCFDILRTDTKQKYVFGCATLADKQKWLKELKNCINNIPAVQDENKQKKSRALRGKELISDIFKTSLRTLAGSDGAPSAKESKLTKEMAAYYVKCLETNDSNFTKLNLAKMNIKFKMLQQIAHSMEHNLVISQIILSHCQLEDKGIIALVNALKDNKSLTVLLIDDNSIRAQGANAVLELVRRHPSMAALSMSDNFIGDAVAIGCAEILQWNTTLRMVDLSKNDISDTSARYFAEAILVNHTISELYLDHNMISPKGEALIEKALEDSYSSCVVVLEVNKITPSVEAKLKKNKDRAQRAGQNYSFQQILDEAMNQLDKGPVLDLGFYRLDGCPLSRLSLSSLTQLYLDNCGLSYIPPVFFSAHSLTMFSLVNNSIAYLPPGLFDLESLVHLDLTNNRLVNRLPEEISKLINLKTLILSSNALSLINVELTYLTNLKKLHLQGNQLYQLPFQIFSMTSLEDLNLTGNPMPEVFQQLYKAWAAKSSELDLSNMSLAEIPAEIGYLKSLTTLRLAHNRLRFLPPQLGDLSNLKLLDIRDNLLMEIPWQLEQLSSLERMDFAGNTKLSYPEDATVIRNILRQQKTFKAGPFRKVKLMLVGRENVGKTSIRQCLQAKDIKALIKMKKERGANISTDGIEMEDWIPQLDEASSSRDFKKQPTGLVQPPQFNIWDYGGQEVYYLTHQFFINQRSIYLVIFNLKDRSEEISRVEYWLQSIRARAVQCPIGMVGTHADEVSNEYLENIKEYINQKYISVFPNIKFFVPVSCKTRKNITNLQEVLLKLAMEQSYINTNYPASFHQLEELLLSQRNLRTPPVITMSEFTLWAESCGISAGQINSAAKLMNDLGVIVYFDDSKFGLNDFVILDPQWLTRLMSTLITTKPNFVKNGILLNRDLSQIWKPPEFPDSLHNALLSLLEKFEISYPLPAEKGFKRNLIPYLIQNEKGMEVFKLTSQAQVVRRSYRFEFLPFGFFSRLTVRVMHFIEPLYYYKNGIVFREDSGSWCLLEYATDSKLQLNIEVSGALATRLLRLIVETVEVLLRGWYSVGYEVFVGCNCPRCLRIPIDKRSSYTLMECERQLAQDKPGVSCVPSMEFTDFPSELRGTISVAFESLAPDLVMSDLQEYKVNYNDIQWQEKLGQGGFGEVFKATLNGEVVAVKKLGVDLQLDDIVEVVREFRKEVWLSSTLQHPCIVLLKGCCVQPRPCMVLEYVPFGNLMSLLGKQDKALPWNWRYKAALNIADAVRFLHSRSPKIIHRDLKSPNVLVVSLSDDAEVVCKVTDFGESLAVATKAAARDKLANPAWLAPEIMRKEPYTEKADVFSFGIVMNELASRTPPYSEHDVSRSRFLSQFEDAILQGLRPTIPSETPEAYAKLIRDCWHDDPDQRPRMEDLYTALHTILKNKPPSLDRGSKPQLKPRTTFARGRSQAQLMGMERLMGHNPHAPLSQSDPGTSSVTSPPVPRDKPAPPPSSAKPKAAPPAAPKAAEKPPAPAPTNQNQNPPVASQAPATAAPAPAASPMSPPVQKAATAPPTITPRPAPVAPPKEEPITTPASPPPQRPTPPNPTPTPATTTPSPATGTTPGSTPTADPKPPSRALPTPAPRRPASASNASPPLQTSSTAPASTGNNNNPPSNPSVPRPIPRVSPHNLQKDNKEPEKPAPGSVKNQVNLEHINNALSKGPSFKASSTPPK